LRKAGDEPVNSRLGDWRSKYDHGEKLKSTVDNFFDIDLGSLAI
jgi:hypothetical protein